MKIEEALTQTGVKLDNAFIEYLDARIGESAGQNQIEAWGRLPELFRQYHALFALDSEVFNGGFERYFRKYSSHPPFVVAALRGLDLVSPAHAKLAQEAVSIFVHYMPKLEQVVETFSIPPSPKLTHTDIDQQFQTAGDIHAIRIAWLEANRNLIRESL